MKYPWNPYETTIKKHVSHDPKTTGLECPRGRRIASDLHLLERAEGAPDPARAAEARRSHGVMVVG